MHFEPQPAIHYYTTNQLFITLFGACHLFLGPFRNAQTAHTVVSFVADCPENLVLRSGATKLCVFTMKNGGFNYLTNEKWGISPMNDGKFMEIESVLEFRVLFRP